MIASVILLGLLVPAIAAGPVDEACQRNLDRYEAAKAEIADALRTYERCVSGSQARDTCETEFADLDLAQARFENAVAEYDQICRQRR